MLNESGITVQNEGDILILEIQEPRISEGLVIEALSNELEVIFQDSKYKKILLNLHQVELVSSGMLSVLVRLYRELAERMDALRCVVCDHLFRRCLR